MIGDHDALHFPAADIAPSEVLHALMHQHGLTQSELAKELGSQGVVSEILSGKQVMNLSQMRVLENRFSVPVAAFVGGTGVIAE